MKRLLPVALTLLVIAVVVQLASISTTAERLIGIAVVSIFAALASFAFCWRFEKLTSGASSGQAAPSGGGPDYSVQGTVHDVLAWRRPVSCVVGIVLLAVTGWSAWAGGNALYSPPSGTFTRYVQHQPLASRWGWYLFQLHGVRNLSTDLVWFELADPLYSSSHIQTYQYYYTQASQQIGPTGDFAAELPIANSGSRTTADVVTAFACSDDDTRVGPGSGNATIRKQAGCIQLDYICVQVAKCTGKGRGCVAESFTSPPECKPPFYGAPAVPPPPSPSRTASPPPSS